MEDNLRMKATLGGKKPQIEKTLDGAQPMMEDNLQWKTTFHESGTQIKQWAETMYFAK